MLYLLNLFIPKYKLDVDPKVTNTIVDNIQMFANPIAFLFILNNKLEILIKFLVL